MCRLREAKDEPKEDISGAMRNTIAMMTERENIVVLKI